MNATLPLVSSVAATVLVIFCAATDLRDRTIPNRATYTGLAVGLILAASCGTQALGLAAAGAALGFFPALVAFVAGTLGGGDVKLLAALGALVGPLRLVEALFVACALALLWIGARAAFCRVIALARSRRLRPLPGGAPPHARDELPLAPAIAVATLLVLLPLPLAGGAP